MNTLFIDSSIGGLSTLCQVIKLIPNLNFIYFADNKYAPYGNLDTKTITKRLITIINGQLRHNIGLIVLACNTATANSIDILRKIYKIPIIGIEPAIKPASKAGNNILVLATPSTTKHPRFTKLINTCPCSIKFQPMPTLAKLIDDYFLYGEPETQRQLDLLTNSIGKMAQDKTHIVLGCTHYSFLKEKLSKVTNARILDGNYGVCKQVLKFVDYRFCSQTPLQKFVLSDNNSDLCKKYRKIFEETLANV